jgi:hypothetical protein
MDVVGASLIREFPREWWAGVPWQPNVEIDYISSTYVLVASFPICPQQLTSPVTTYSVTDNE